MGITLYLMYKSIAVFLQHPAGVQALSMSDGEVNGILARRLPQCRVIQCHSAEEFTAALPGASFAVTWTFRQEWFALAPHLELVSTPAAGKDYFTVEWPVGIQHWNGSFHGEIMAENAVAGILAMTRGLLPAVTTYADLPWPQREIDRIARPLRGARCTICGFGNIGRWIGRLLKPFGANLWGITAHSGHQPPDYFSDGDALFTADQLNALLPQTDHLVLVLPRSPETSDFIGAERLALLPAHATLTNLGRGNAIDENALAAALRRGHLSGAYLDVTATEPLPAESPLRHCPRLWITPHSSAYSPNYMRLFIEEFASRLEASGLVESSSGFHR